MKMLVSITSTDPKKLGDAALRLLGRIGQDVAIFIPAGKRRKYKEVLLDANYHWYLALQPSVLITGSDAVAWAKRKGYELLVLLPEDMKFWSKDSETEAADFAATVGVARRALSSSRRRIWRFRHKITMVRL